MWKNANILNPCSHILQIDGQKSIFKYQSCINEQKSANIKNVCKHNGEKT